MSCAVRGVVSGSALIARSALTTTSNGDLTLLRYAAAEKNSGDVTIVRTTSRMSPSVCVKARAARSMSAGGGESLGTKTLRSLSLGRVGGKPSEDQLKADIERYSLQSSEIPAGGVKEGLIYFEKPPRNNYTVSITLGDLWSQPFAFSTTRQK